MDTSKIEEVVRSFEPLDNRQGNEEFINHILSIYRSTSKEQRAKVIASAINVADENGYDIKAIQSIPQRFMRTARTQELGGKLRKNNGNCYVFGKHNGVAYY